MTVERRSVTVIIALIIAAVMQMVFTNPIHIGPARPDFILAALAASSIALNITGGAFAGLWAGMLMTAVTNVNYGSFLVSRALAGTFCGWASQWIPIQTWPIGVPVLSFVTTIGSETIYYLMAPTHRGLWWIEHMTLEALYNAVLSLIFAAIMLLTGLRPPKKGAFD